MKKLFIGALLITAALIPSSTQAFYTDAGEGAGRGYGDVSYYTYTYNYSTGQYQIVACYYANPTCF